jgi:hypothetical protein
MKERIAVWALLLPATIILQWLGGVYSAGGGDARFPAAVHAAIGASIAAFVYEFLRGEMGRCTAIAIRGRSRERQTSGTVTTFRTCYLPPTSEIGLARNGDCPCFFTATSITGF